MIGRPDQFDYELGMLYRLRLQIKDELFVQVGPFEETMSFSEWRDPRIAKQPGLRRALQLVEREIEVRERP